MRFAMPGTVPTDPPMAAWHGASVKVAADGRPPGLVDTPLPLGLLVPAALMVLNAALAVAQPATWTAVCACLLFVAFALRLFRWNPAVVVLLLPLLVIYIASQISMVAIEAGGYMKELGRHGTASSAAALFVLCNLVLLSTAAVVHVRRLRWQPLQVSPPDSGHERPAVLAWGAVLIVGAVCAYLVLVGLATGFPLLTGTDRFAFRRLSADPLLLTFLNLKFIFTAILGTGAAFSQSRVQRVAHQVTFVAYLLISFLFGDKFFIILLAACFFVMPLLIRRPGQIADHVRRHLPAALLVVAAVFVVTVHIYSDYGALSLEATLARLADRVAGQGQLWHVAVEDRPVWLAFDARSVQLNLLNLFANPAADFAFRHRLAAFHFVEHYAPTAMYISFLNNAGTVTPTLVFEAYALVNFGWLGLVAALVAAGAALGGLMTWLARAFMTGNPFNVLLPAFVCTQLLSFLSQAALYSLIGLSAFKAYGAFLVLQVVMAEFVKPRRTMADLR